METRSNSGTQIYCFGEALYISMPMGNCYAVEWLTPLAIVGLAKEWYFYARASPTAETKVSG